MRKLLLALLTLTCIELQALDVDEIKAQMVQEVAEQVLQRHGRAADQIIPADLPAAIYQRPCDEYALTIRQGNNQRWFGRVPVLFRCHTPQAWSVYTTVEVQMQVPVVVATRALTRGERLNSSAVSIKQVPIEQSRDYYLSDTKDVIGKLTRRSIRAGSPVSLNQLSAVDTINKGDRVMIQSGNQRVKIHTYGEALTGGQFGDQIQVRNERSKRIIKPWVWGPGHVGLRPPA